MWIVIEDRLRRPIQINDATIEFIEPLADTRLHLTTGETIVTCLRPDEVLARMVAVRQASFASPPELRPHREDHDTWVPSRV